MLKLFIPDLISFMLALNALAVFVVGAVVYISREKKLQNAIWFVYNILFSIWSFCMYKAQLSTEASTGLYWIRASFVTLIFIAPVFLHFLSIYSDKEVFKKAAVAAIGDAFTAVDVLRSEAVLEEVRKTHVKESYYMFMEMRDQMDRVLG